MKRLLVLATIGISSLWTIDAGAGVTIVNAPARISKTAPRRTVVEAAPREKWVGTRAILRDEATGKLRKPTEAETRELVKTIKQLTARPTVRTEASTRGGVMEAAPAQVVIARATEEGTMETLCVQTFEEAAAFLGLVQQPTGSNEK